MDGRYVTTQVSGGVPFAVPVDERDNNTVAAWCYQQPMVLAPVSGASSSEGLATGTTAPTAGSTAPRVRPSS